MEVPNESDWKSEPWGLDTVDAHRHFAGLDLEQAQTLIATNVDYYYEDLLHIPKSCFSYYFNAFINFLLSNKSEGEVLAPDYLFAIIELRKTDLIGEPVGVSLAEKGLKYVCINHKKFNASPDNVDDLKDRATKILKQLVLI